jgi:hypothetical protein
MVSPRDLIGAATLRVTTKKETAIVTKAANASPSISQRRVLANALAAFASFLAKSMLI